jgi:WD40 repeat protein
MPQGLRPFAAFAPDGKTVAVVDRTQSFVTAFDVASRRQRFRVRVPMLLSAVCLSPDGNTLALGCSDKKMAWQIQLWNLHAQKLDRTLDGGNGTVKCLAFAPDGKMLASTATDRSVRLWDLTTGKQHATIPGSSPATSLVFAPSGKRLAAAEGGTVRLIEAATKKEILSLPGSLKVTSTSFSPDERRLATGGGDEDLGRGFGVKVWDLTTRREVLALAGPT